MKSDLATRETMQEMLLTSNCEKEEEDLSTEIDSIREKLTVIVIICSSITG